MLNVMFLQVKYIELFNVKCNVKNVSLLSTTLL